MRISTLFGALLASTVLLLPLATSAAAQDRDCSDFSSQSEAQQALDGTVGDPERLDSDGDGIACETLGSATGSPNDPQPDNVVSIDDEDDSDSVPAATTTGDTNAGRDRSPEATSTGLVPLAATAARDRDCPDFASRAEAQQALDSSVGDPERLDATTTASPARATSGSRRRRPARRAPRTRSRR